MKLLKRVVVGLLLIAAGFVLFLVLSVAVDSWVGRERVSQLTNTEVPADAVPAVAAYVAQPEGPGPFPAVIMLHEFWGLQPELIGKAEALADEGYVVVAPDMYRGQATGWLPRAIYLAITVPEERVLGDLAPVYDWLAAQPQVDPARIVVMGFCYGGGKALQFSLVNGELAGTGVFYGALESDPAVLSRLPGPVLGVFGAEDTAPPPEEVAQFQVGLEAAGIPHEITVYEGVGHAFVKDMEGIRQGGAQGEAWDQFLAWLARTVG